MTVSLEVLTEDVVHPGDVARVVVVASTPDHRKCDAITVRLVAHVRIGKASWEAYDRSQTQATTELPRGRTRFVFDFDVPKDAPPTIDTPKARIFHEAHATADLPWALDPSASGEVVVALPHVPIAKTRVKKRVRAKSKEKIEQRAGLLVRFPKEVVQGGAISGTVEISTGSGSVRALAVALIAHTRERDLVEVNRVVVRRPNRFFEDGELVEVELPLAPEMPPTFDVGSVSVRHFLAIEADRGHLAKLSTVLPIAVRPRELPKRAKSDEDAAPPVDPAEQRRAAALAAWAAATRRVDKAKYTVRADVEATRFELVREGATTRITSEVTPEKGPRLKARLAWDSLGVGLRVEDAVTASFDGVPLRGDLGDRCRVAVRTEEQAAALLSEPLQRALARFQSVRLHDRGGVVESAGSILTRGHVSAFVDHCMALQRSMRVRRKLLPVHPAVAAHEAAYRAFAARRRATVAPGDLAIDRAEPGGVGWSLRFRFSGAAVVGTDALSAVDESIELIADARAQAQEQLGQTVDKSGRDLRMSLPLTTDPADIEALLDAFVDLTRSLARGARRSPYR